MNRWRLLHAVVLAAMVAATTTLAEAQSGQQLVITMTVAARVQDQGGAYYIAFAVTDSLLAGPQPDSTNWTHYILYRDGRFFFGVVPPTTVRPFGFAVIRPPTPFLSGQVLPERRGLQVRVPIADLRTGPALPARVLINFVTVDEANRPLDALGQGASDQYGFVTVDLRRDSFVTVRASRGNCPDPNFDITGGEIRITTP